MSRRACSAFLFLPLVLLSGCAGFFAKDATTGTGTGTGAGTNATNFVFVANESADSVTGLGISSTGALSTLSGSPINFNVAPLAMAVSRNNAYLWVGTQSQIFAYALSSTGAIAQVNNGNAVANATNLDMQTTPDGKWLMVLDGTANGIDLFAINSDGTLSPSSGVTFPINGGTLKALRIAASGTFVVADDGSAGELVFGFNTTTGVFTQLSTTTPPNLTSDNSIAIDSTGTYLYCVRTGSNAGLVVFSIASNGTLTPTTTAVYATGSQPTSVVLDNSGKYVYVANLGDSTITGYSIGTNAALTPVSGSPFSSGVGVTALGADSTGKWLLAAASLGSPDLSLYGFDSTNLGRLFAVSSSATATNAGASVVALSH